MDLMETAVKPISRRKMLIKAGGVATSILCVALQARAEYPYSVGKRSALYRTDGLAKNKCMDCRLFIPGDSDKLPSCLIVESPVEPNAGCALWELRAAGPLAKERS